MNCQPVAIGGRVIGPGNPPYVIAEMSANHNGSLDRAFELMKAAHDAGADAVKIQTYTADTITIDHDSPEFRINGGPWHGRTLYDLYNEAHTPWEWHPALFEMGRQIGITVFSSPFDASAVDFLRSLDAPAYKIASFEAIDLPLIAHAASTGKPLIISTGMAGLKEIDEAVAAARAAGCRDLVLLHCVSGYPAPAEDANLRTIPDMARRFSVSVGLSDHSLGNAVAVAAVGLGASIIEKHMTLRRDGGGVDAGFSAEPDEMAALTEACRVAFAALGEADYSPKASERGNMLFRRSLYVVEDLAEGDLFTDENLRSIRPGYGLAPKRLPDVLGKRAAREIPRGSPLDQTMISPALAKDDH